MYKNIFDTHAHYDDTRYDGERDQLLAALPSLGICGVLNCGTGLAQSYICVKLANKYDYMYASVGIHPHEAEADRYFTDKEFIALCKQPKVVAIGEIGLDYHYNLSAENTQIEVFERQLTIANQLDLPVIIHSREATEKTLQILKSYKPKGVVHCFSSSLEVASELITLGMYIGIGGPVTFKNAKHVVNVAQNIPLEYLVLETDAPYLSPEPFRGKRNQSDYIGYVAERIADLRGISTQQLLDITTQNAMRLYNIKSL